MCVVEWSLCRARLVIRAQIGSKALAAICAQAHTQAGIVRRGDHGARGRVHEHRRELGRERSSCARSWTR